MKEKTALTFDIYGDVEFTRGDQTAHYLTDGVFGLGSMKRVTDIFMTSDRRYAFLWLDGPYANSIHKIEQHWLIFGENYCLKEAGKKHNFLVNSLDIITFSDYEDAAAYERECIKAMRLQGIVFGE